MILVRNFKETTGMKAGKKPVKTVIAAMLLAIMAAAFATAQTTPYQPKYAGDPAHSDSEFVALAYMRTVLRAQHTYKKKYGKFAPSLADLVHSGSFTKRMTQTQQGDYTVKFHTRKDGFELTMTPRQQDADHRSFYANEDGVIRGDDQQAATESSPKA
jgi:hypothetical protein